MQTLIKATRGGTRACLLLLAAAGLLCAPRVHAQTRVMADLARQGLVQLPAGATSLNIAVNGVTLGMPWGEARNVLERANIPYAFNKGTAPVVYVQPQNPTWYYVLNPSSYDVIEMGIIGTADLPLENQHLFDGQRWKLTTARTQFFGNEGESIVNEEGEAFNFPYLGFVLKYVTPGNFRFVMVAPTNKPLTSYGRGLRGEGPAPQAPAEGLDAWIAKFQKARDQFEHKHYATSLSAFRHIAENAPDPLLRIRSVYWTGEALYGMKQFKNARLQFERVLKETDIESLRAPAQKMLARCNRRLKK